MVTPVLSIHRNMVFNNPKRCSTTDLASQWRLVYHSSAGVPECMIGDNNHGLRGYVLSTEGTMHKDLIYNNVRGCSCSEVLQHDVWV